MYTCCAEKKIATCASCEEFAVPRDYAECTKVNSFIAKVFTSSNRPAALAMLRDQGEAAYLAEKRQCGKM